MFSGASASAAPSFYTNSGASGEGSGAALGSPFMYTKAQLQAFTSGTNTGTETLNARAYLADSLKNAFANSANSIGSRPHWNMS